MTGRSSLSTLSPALERLFFGARVGALSANSLFVTPQSIELRLKLGEPKFAAGIIVELVPRAPVRITAARYADHASRAGPGAGSS